MSAIGKRADLEDAIAHALDVAWRSAVAYCASRLTAPGVPLGYPDRVDVTAVLLARADEYANAKADEEAGRFRLAAAVSEYHERRATDAR